LLKVLKITTTIRFFAAPDLFPLVKGYKDAKVCALNLRILNHYATDYTSY